MSIFNILKHILPNQMYDKNDIFNMNQMCQPVTSENMCGIDDH